MKSEYVTSRFFIMIIITYCYIGYIFYKISANYQVQTIKSFLRSFHRIKNILNITIINLISNLHIRSRKKQ